jgi:YD repeat-containing protein
MKMTAKRVGPLNALSLRSLRRVLTSALLATTTLSSPIAAQVVPDPETAQKAAQPNPLISNEQSPPVEAPDEPMPADESAEPSASTSTSEGEEDDDLDPPDVHPNVDPNGVDLVRGTFHFSQRLVSIGGDWPRGLHFTRSWTGDEWTDNLAGSYTYTPVGTTVSIEGGSDNLEGNGSTFTGNTYTTKSGKVAVFETYDQTYNGPLHRLSEIRYPDGTIVKYHYKHFRTCAHISCTSFNRLQSVTNNHGYQIKLSYNSEVWDRVTGAIAINNAVEYCDPYADSCALTTSWPSATISEAFNGTDLVETVTDPAGGAWLINHGNDPQKIQSIRRPGLSISDIEVEYHPMSSAKPLVAAVTRAGARFTYTRDTACGSCPLPPPYTELMTVRDPLGNAYAFLTRHRRLYSEGGGEPFVYHPVILSVTDPLSRKISYEYDSYLRPVRVTLPEGNYVQYGYDTFGNVASRTQVAKDPSITPPIIREARYLCTYRSVCDLPELLIDAKNNMTQFTYSPDHGGVLSTTFPAASTDLQPQRRFEYIQRSARVKTASGTYVEAAPVWLVSAESFCRTSAATGNPASPCAVVGDEVRTTYDYGPNSGPNNLQPRSVVVTADGVSRRSCYGYDRNGYRISETGPGAGLAACP